MDQKLYAEKMKDIAALLLDMKAEEVGGLLFAVQRGEQSIVMASGNRNDVLALCQIASSVNMPKFDKRYEPKEPDLVNQEKETPKLQEVEAGPEVPPSGAV